MRRYLIFALLLTLAPSAAQAQRPGPMRGEHHGADRDPIQFILEHRQDLALTAEQVQRLEAIRAELKRENDPLIARLREQMPDRPAADSLRQRMRQRRELTDEQRQQMRARMEQMRARMEEMRPVREEIRENLEDAIDDVDDVLNDEQEKKLRELRRAERDKRREEMRKRRGNVERMQRRPGRSGS